MLDKVISTIERHKMLNNGTTVIVAVSGGADSMALLSLLCRLKDQLNLNIFAAHVNHGLRAEESKRDEYFVTDYCKNNSIPLYLLKSNIDVLASSTGEGVEQCGRRVRYDFLKSLDDNAVVATAHTLSDSIETIIFNLARGSALKGLCGIPAVRSGIIRPLIECTRGEIEDYCQENGIHYITDSTNTNEQYTRNHIRANIIPQFYRINIRFQEAFLRCSESLSLDESLLTELSEKLLYEVATEGGYRTDQLLSAHPSLRRRVLAFILKTKTGAAPENKHIEAIDTLLKTGGKLQVNNCVQAEVSNGLVKFYGLRSGQEKWCCDLSDGNIEIGDKKIELKIVNRSDLESIKNIHTNILDNCLDYDKIFFKAVIRSRCEGDKIRLSRRHCTKSIKKLFNEAAVPVHERNNLAIIADATGVLWVEKFGVSDRCEINDSTERILMISIRRI